MPAPPKLDKPAWKERIAPALTRSMQEVRERITNERHVQSWIRTASYEAAMSIGDPSDMQAEAQAYGHMMDSLKDTFPELDEAVRELTQECGALDIQWRPLSPEYTSIYIDFGTDYRVDVFCNLKAASPDETRRALDTAAAALPKSQPFPRRPNEATGVVALDGRCVGVRAVDRHPGDSKPRRTYTLLPPGSEPEKDLPTAEAANRIVTHLTPDPGTVSPDEWIGS